MAARGWGGAGGSAAGGGSIDDGIGSLADLSPRQLRSALGQLSDNDVAKLKQTCADVLSGGGVGFSDDTVAVCQVIAAL